MTIHAEPEDEHDDTLPEIDAPRSNTTLQSARSSIDPREIVRADEVDEVVSVSSQATPRFIPPAAPRHQLVLLCVPSECLIETVVMTCPNMAPVQLADASPSFQIATAFFRIPATLRMILYLVGC